MISSEWAQLIQRVHATSCWECRGNWNNLCKHRIGMTGICEEPGWVCSSILVWWDNSDRMKSCLLKPFNENSLWNLTLSGKKITSFLMSWSSGEKIILLLTNKEGYWMLDCCKECVVLLDHWRVAVICVDYQSCHLCFSSKWTLPGLYFLWRWDAKFNSKDEIAFSEQCSPRCNLVCLFLCSQDRSLVTLDTQLCKHTVSKCHCLETKIICVVLVLLECGSYGQFFLQGESLKHPAPFYGGLLAAPWWEVTRKGNTLPVSESGVASAEVCALWPSGLPVLCSL